MFTVTVKTLEGQDTVFDVDEETKVDQFKELIESRLNIPVARQRLIFQGKVLADDKRLIDLGVQDKAVHLVPRPPPLETENQTPEPSGPEMSNASTTNISGFPWNDMQHTLQGITSGILSSLLDLGRGVPGRPQGHQTNANGQSSVQLRIDTFDRLHREATNILERLERQASYTSAVISNINDGAPNGEPGEGGSSDEPTHESRNADFSPMAVDPSPIADATIPENDEAQQSETESRHPDQHMSNLAGMLSRYRQLWQAVEAHLIRWEEMLNDESRLQESISEQSTRSAADQQSTSQLTAEILGPVSQPPISQPSVEDTKYSSNWHNAFFNRVSQLMHLQAHMLHLISDFDVRPSPVAANAASQGHQETLAATDETSETNATTPMYPRRVLTAPEPNNTFRTTFDLASVPPNRIPTGPHANASTRTQTEAGSGGNRNEAPMTVTTSTDNTVTASQQAQSDATAQPQIVPATATIIHRVEIPIISMNMVNLPSQVLEQFSSMASTLPPVTTSSTSTAATIANSSADTTTTTNTSSTTDPASLASNTATTVTQSTARPNSHHHHHHDPFLHCHSRHFGRERSRRFVPMNIPGLQVVTGDISAPSANRTTQSTEAADSVTTAAATTGSTTTSTSTGGSGEDARRDVAHGFSLPFNLSQQLTSLVSAAASAASSVFSSSSGAHLPFDLLVTASSVPVSVGQTITTIAGANPFWISGGGFPFVSVPPVPSANRAASTVPRRGLHPAARSSRVMIWNGEPYPVQLLGRPRVLHTLVEGLVETVWNSLSEMIRQSGGELNRIVTENREDASIATPSISTNNVVDSFLSAVFASFHYELANAGVLSGSVTPQSLEDVRMALSCHSEHMMSRSDFLEAILNCLFNGRTTDADRRTEASPFERQLLDWVREHSQPANGVVDVRASFARLIRSIVKSLLESWRVSSSSCVFDSEFFRRLQDHCMDLLCMADLLINHLASATGLRTSPQAVTSSQFRIAGQFQCLSNRRQQFVTLNSDTAVDSGLWRVLSQGMNRCIQQYTAMDVSELMERRDRISRDFLVIEGFASQGNTGDKKSELVSNVANALASDQSSVARIADLPSFTPAPGEVPEPWIRGLDPHPGAAQLSSVPSADGVEGWHAVLPVEWTPVVCNDIAFQRNSAGDLKPVNHFSDAYIAGMPAKRRKVMENKAKSAAQTPEALFSECLSEAIQSSGRSSECPAPSPPDAANLMQSLRQHVSDRIAKRLSNDPDFDQGQFPLASSMFMKRNTK